MRFWRKVSTSRFCNSRSVNLSRKSQKHVQFRHSFHEIVSYASQGWRPSQTFVGSRCPAPSQISCLQSKCELTLKVFCSRCGAIVDGLCCPHRLLRPSTLIHQVEAKGGVGTNAKYHELVRAYEHKLGVRGLHFTVSCATDSFAKFNCKPALFTSLQACNMAVGHFGGSGSNAYCFIFFFLQNVNIYTKFVIFSKVVVKTPIYSTLSNVFVHDDRTRHDRCSKHGRSTCNLRAGALCFQPAITQCVAAGASHHVLLISVNFC